MVRPTKVTPWIPLQRRGKYSSRLRTLARGEVGTYAIRDRQSKTVEYVGESHTGRLWKTLLRHFQGQESFAAVGEWTHPDPEQVEVRVWIFEKPQQAIDFELQQIETLAPTAQVEPVPF